MTVLRATVLALSGMALLELAMQFVYPGAPRLPAFFEERVTSAGVPTYGLRPNAAQTYLDRSHRIRVSIDKDGRRTVPGSGVTGARTLHVIGDSQVFGWGLSDHETIPAILQRRLGTTWSVVNHGLPGAGPDYYVSTLRGIDRGDAAVVVFTETNDLQDTYSPLPIGIAHCGFIVVPSGVSAVLPCWVLRSQIYGLIVDAGQLLLAQPLPLPLCYNASLRIACATAHYRATAALTFEVKVRNGSTVLLTIPWEGRTDPRAVARYRPLWTASDTPSQASLLLPGHEFVLAALTEAGGLEAFQPDDHHLSAHGASVLADLIVRRLNPLQRSSAQ